jgi:hypothetical protein
VTLILFPASRRQMDQLPPRPRGHRKCHVRAPHTARLPRASMKTPATLLASMFRTRYVMSLPLQHEIMGEVCVRCVADKSLCIDR